MSTHCIVYRSMPVFSGAVSGYLSEVDRMLATARRRNPQVGVTGALLFNEDWFVQILEGGRAAVHATFHRIAQDPRHEGVELLVDMAVPERLFPDWSMGFVGDAPAIRNRFNASPLAQRDLVLRDDAIIDFMVDVARGHRVEGLAA